MYEIFTDASADISTDFLVDNNIHYISMNYTLGTDVRVCDGIEDMNIIKKFYDGQRGGDLTQTSQITPHNYKQYIEPVMKEGKSALYLSLSSGLSSTYQSAMMAKAELEEDYPGTYFYPVDTLAATGGMGLLVERACRNRDKGMTIEENYEDLKKAASRIRHWFLVQNLMYLKRGGRVSAATAVIGTALNIKPVLEIDKEGKLTTIAKKRGDQMAARELINRFKESFDPDTDDVIYVVDADIPELAEFVKTEVEKLYPDKTIRRTYLSPIIGAHTGPGMVALCHMGKD